MRIVRSTAAAAMTVLLSLSSVSVLPVAEAAKKSEGLFQCYVLNLDNTGFSMNPSLIYARGKNKTEAQAKANKMLSTAFGHGKKLRHCDGHDEKDGRTHGFYINGKTGEIGRVEERNGRYTKVIIWEGKGSSSSWGNGKIGSSSPW